MITFTLEGQEERIAPVNPFPTLEHTPLYHQWRTWRALDDVPIVVNTYNTGTGKTIASLLHLFRLSSPRDHVLFIAPTNALIAQHSADIREFVGQNKLPHRVAEVNAARLRALGGERSGKTLVHLLDNPHDFSDELGIEEGDYRRRPLVLVTNPDIFYYALMYRYQRHDQRNLFEAMVGRFRYMVVDEFHYYNSKQFANFLFYFLLLKKWANRLGGDRGQRICLLSATPSQSVINFFDRAFGDQWRLISPSNEPADAIDLPTVPTLTALDVTVQVEEMQEWAANNAQSISKQLEAGEHGVMISNALWRINQSYQLLRNRIPDAHLARITGPEPESARQAATAAPLILATPTVDIGYNFKKYGKRRQNIDFVVSDGRFTDEWVQRLGRAGRILGKTVVDRPSRATLLLSPAAVDAFRPLADKTFSRQEFARWLAEASGLPYKHDLVGYIRSDAIMENFYPIWKLQENVAATEQGELDEFYYELREIFAPTSRRRPGGIAAFFRRHRDRQMWLEGRKNGSFPLSDTTLQMMADWSTWRRGLSLDRPASKDEVSVAFDVCSNSPKMRQQLGDFVAGQVALTESLFSFRDSFNGPTAAIVDPQQLFSSEQFGDYDLLHIIANYEVELLTPSDYRRLGGVNPSPDAIPLKLRRFRDPRWLLSFELEIDEEEGAWKSTHTKRVIPLRGLKVRARSRDGRQWPLPKEIRFSLEEQWLTSLLVPVESEAKMRARLRGSTFFPYQLTVNFRDVVRDDYHIFIGTAAWLSYGELRSHFWALERQEPAALIV